MKKLSKKTLCLLLLVFSYCPSSFAQIPDPNDDPISEEDPPPPTPIDSPIAVLLVAGTGLACCRMCRKTTNQKHSQAVQISFPEAPNLNLLS